VVVAVVAMIVLIQAKMEVLEEEVDQDLIQLEEVVIHLLQVQLKEQMVVMQHPVQVHQV
jgi:hypothetical protein